MIKTRFESIGAAFPAHTLTTSELIDKMNFKPQFNIEEITGIKNRRVCNKNETSFSLAIGAAKDCLQRSRYKAADLDIIISTSITRVKEQPFNQYLDPAFSLLLARELGANSAIHFDVSNACAGMLSGVYFLDRLIKSGAVKNGLVVSGEYITPIADTAVKEIHDPLDPQFASLTVGDSGAAVIMDKSENVHDQIHYVELMTCAEYSHLCIGKPSEKDGAPALYTNNREMHSQDRVRIWPEFQKDFLAQRNTNFENEKYDYIVHHQVGKKTMKNFSKYGEAVFNAKVPESLFCVDDYANTATTSHFIVLYNHIKEKKVHKGAKFLFVPAASGVVTGCLSTTITSLEV